MTAAPALLAALATTATPTLTAAFFPQPLEPYTMSFSAGLQHDVLPTALVEGEMRHLPMLTLAGRLGLPYGLSAHLRVAAVAVSNEVELGAAMGASFGRFAARAQWAVGMVFGFLGSSGFDASSWAFIHKPSLSLGLTLPAGLRLTGIADAVVTSAQRVSFGDAAVLNRTKTSLAAWSFMVVFEQALWDAHGLYAGAAAVGALPDHLMWFAFSDSSARVWYPRLVLGYFH